MGSVYLCLLSGHPCWDNQDCACGNSDSTLKARVKLFVAVSTLLQEKSGGNIWKGKQNNKFSPQLPGIKGKMPGLQERFRLNYPDMVYSTVDKMQDKCEDGKLFIHSCDGEHCKGLYLYGEQKGKIIKGKTRGSICEKAVATLWLKGLESITGIMNGNPKLEDHNVVSSIKIKRKREQNKLCIQTNNDMSTNKDWFSRLISPPKTLPSTPRHHRANASWKTKLARKKQSAMKLYTTVVTWEKLMTTKLTIGISSELIFLSKNILKAGILYPTWSFLSRARITRSEHTSAVTVIRRSWPRTSGPFLEEVVHYASQAGPLTPRTLYAGCLD